MVKPLEVPEELWSKTVQIRRTVAKSQVYNVLGVDANKAATLHDIYKEQVRRIQKTGASDAPVTAASNDTVTDRLELLDGEGNVLATTVDGDFAAQIDQGFLDIEARKAAEAERIAADEARRAAKRAKAEQDRIERELFWEEERLRVAAEEEARRAAAEEAAGEGQSDAG